MVQNNLYWCDLYQKHKFESLCLDVEWTGRDGPISMVGLYRPKEGVIETTTLIRGQNLDTESLAAEFSGIKLIITFNGLKSDIPAINKEFPGAIPATIPVFDLYFRAKEVNMNTNLKVLENTFGIFRMDERTKRRFIAQKLWWKWEQKRDKKALDLLIEYNRQDTINLYPLAEELVKLVYKKPTI